MFYILIYNTLKIIIRIIILIKSCNSAKTHILTCVTFLLNKRYYVIQVRTFVEFSIHQTLLFNAALAVTVAWKSPFVFSSSMKYAWNFQIYSNVKLGFISFLRFHQSNGQNGEQRKCKKHCFHFSWVNILFGSEHSTTFCQSNLYKSSEQMCSLGFFNKRFIFIRNSIWCTVGWLFSFCSC